MKRAGSAFAALAILLTWCCLSVSAPEEVVVKSFSLDELGTQGGQPYLPFLDEAGLSAGLYRLKADGVDRQSPHELDEVYYIVAGSSRFVAANERFDVRPGQAIWVRAGVPHRFYDIARDLTILVMFSKKGTDPNEPEAELQTPLKISDGINPEENHWNPFFSFTSLQFGLYSLPQSVGGDSALVHEWDELNVVLTGAGSFTAGQQTLDFKAGQLMFVGAETPHWFHDLTGDTEILILFARSQKKD